MLLPVGGHIELDETPWAAVLHEVLEEAGYEPSQLQILQPALRMDGVELTREVNHPLPFFLGTHVIESGHYHTDMGYVFTTGQPPAKQPLAGESTDLRWLVRSALASLTADDIYADVKARALYAFDVVLPNYQPVPASAYNTAKPPALEAKA
jgi:8-oxo-dGTP pyrophosphatase MutT (NUDIX family)